MILNAFFAALSQISDPRFMRVVLLGIGWAIVGLVGLGWLFIELMSWVFADGVTLPWIGHIAVYEGAVFWTSLAMVTVFSVFLMIPAAGAISSFFIEDVARAVEDRHYPHVTPNASLSFADQISESARFFAIIVVANMIVFLLSFILFPLAPFMYWAVNGYLFGREYFMLVALRHLSRPEAHQVLREKSGVIWMAGILMVMPMSIPFVNLAIPVLGAATFTHLFHRF